MTNHEIADAAVRTAPPLGISGAMLLGLTLSDWVLVCTLVYTLASLFFLIRRELKRHKEEKREQSDRR